MNRKIALYGKDMYTTKVTNALYQILGTVATFTEDFELLSDISKMQNTLRDCMTEESQDTAQTNSLEE